jgi:hypothetical protein
MGFLDNYEAARERIERWHRTNPNGRIETSIVDFNAEKGYILVEARGYRNADDTLPAGIDYAYGYQGAYVQNMKRWFVEDTTTSAILRVMQLIMGGAERTTKEVMEQVEKMPAKVANSEQDYDYWTTKFGDVPSFKTREEAEESGIPTVAKAIDEIKEKLGGQLMPEAPQCKHGHRIFKSGEAKTGKAWGGWFCVEKKPQQCDPLWYVLTSSGQWAPQV